MHIKKAKELGCPFGGKCSGPHCMSWLEAVFVLSEAEYADEEARCRKWLPKASDDDVDEYLSNLGVCSIVESFRRNVMMEGK